MCARVYVCTSKYVGPFKNQDGIVRTVIGP